MSWAHFPARTQATVLVAMDYFTKWPEVCAIPDQVAKTVVDALVEGSQREGGSGSDVAVGVVTAGGMAWSGPTVVGDNRCIC